MTTRPTRQDPAAVLAKLGSILARVLGEFGVETAIDEAPQKLLALLVRRWRDELDRRDAKVRRAVTEHLDFLDALQAAAMGQKPDPAKAGEGLDIIRGVRDLVTAKESQERECARLRADLSRLHHRLDTLEAERRHFSSYPEEGSEDERLELYRRAFAEWERGKDPKPLLEEIRERERVFVVDDTLADRTQQRLGECLDTLAGRLEELYRILPLGEDPKRFRPRRFRGRRYDLESLTGITAAFSDAAGSVMDFLEQAKQFAGIETMGEELDTLKPAFTEMVRLVADCRQESAGQVTLSMAVSLETRAGMASLPAVLAHDIQALLRTRKGRERADEVTEVLTDCVDYYRAALVKAVGAAPEPTKASAREKPPGRLARLNKDLLALAAAQEHALYEAEVRHWELHAGEKALLDDPHLLLRALQDIDMGCDVLAVLPGAPEASFPELPSPRRFALQDLLEPCRQRRLWLAEIARYRVTPAG